MKKVSGGHCPSAISEEWCRNKWCEATPNGVKCDGDGLRACYATFYALPRLFRKLT